MFLFPLSTYSNGHVLAVDMTLSPTIFVSMYFLRQHGVRSQSMVDKSTSIRLNEKRKTQEGRKNGKLGDLCNIV